MIPRKKKREHRRLFFHVRAVLLFDKKTGEIIGKCKALVAKDRLTKRAMEARGYRDGDEVSGDLKKGRNYQQWKTAHGLGLMCIEQIERFQEYGKDAHAALKALQRESGIACETMRIDASPVVAAVLAAAEQVCNPVVMFALRKILPSIKTIDVNEAMSLSYETMDSGKFTEVFDALCGYVLTQYWPQLDETEGRAKIHKWIGEHA